MAHLARAVRIGGCSLPRNLSLISGADSAAGTEGCDVHGAHGPRHLHVVLVEC